MSDLGVTLLRLYRQGQAISQMPGDDYTRSHCEELGRALRALGTHGGELVARRDLGPARALLVEIGHGLAALPVPGVAVQPGPASALDPIRLKRGLDCLDSLRSSARLLLDAVCDVITRIPVGPILHALTALVDLADALVSLTYHVPAHAMLAETCYAMAVGDALCCLARDLTVGQDPGQAGGDASTDRNGETPGRDG